MRKQNSLLNLQYIDGIGLSQKEFNLFRKLNDTPSKETIIEFTKFCMNYTLTSRVLFTRILGSITYFEVFDSINSLDEITKDLLENTIPKELTEIEAYLFASAKHLEFSCDFDYELMSFSKLKALHYIERYEFVIKVFSTIKVLVRKLQELVKIDITLELQDISKEIRETLNKSYGLSFTLTENFYSIL